MAYVYKLYDLFGECVYVGQTKNIRNRISQHEKANCEWFSYVDFITVNNVESALIIERMLISSINPVYNKTHRTDPYRWSVCMDRYKKELNKKYKRREEKLHRDIEKHGIEYAWNNLKKG